MKRCLEGMILGFIFLVYLSFLMDVGWKYKFIRGCLINGGILRILKALLFMLLCYLLEWFFGCFKIKLIMKNLYYFLLVFVVVVFVLGCKKELFLISYEEVYIFFVYI